MYYRRRKRLTTLFSITPVFEVPNPNGLLRLDMTAQVHIQLTDVKNVLTIPLSALGDPVGDNRYKVKLLRNGETREREVTIGARNDTDVEIVKGLEAGDEVVIGEAKPELHNDAFARIKGYSSQLSCR
ncbi:macrolide-specific efflux protein [Escherichia coli]|uniref:Macrolide-specific efflux protein n=1 Tax=Escherichia coli TaxID=562 RepID=A0A376RLI5_ECOLX|nr:macrolide-specific efflux protein [Escherichia coli]